MEQGKFPCAWQQQQSHAFHSVNSQLTCVKHSGKLAAEIPPWQSISRKIRRAKKAAPYFPICICFWLHSWYTVGVVYLINKFCYNLRPNWSVCLTESRCESNPVSQWCVLPWGQHCSRILHGDFLQEGRRHMRAFSCHHSSNCHWRRMYEQYIFSLISLS